MNRLHISLGLASGLLVGVTACGGGGTTGTFQPEGSGSSATPTATATVSQVSVVHFPFPASIHIDFANPQQLTSSAQSQAVAIYEDYQLAYYYAIYSGNKSYKYLTYLVTREPQLQAVESSDVAKYSTQSFTGTLKFSDISVSTTPGTTDGLDVSACVNQQRLFSTSRSTGQIVPGQTSTPKGNVTLDVYSLIKESGNWKIAAIRTTPYPNGAAGECYS